MLMKTKAFLAILCLLLISVSKSIEYWLTLIYVLQLHINLVLLSSFWFIHLSINSQKLSGLQWIKINQKGLRMQRDAVLWRTCFCWTQLFPGYGFQALQNVWQKKKLLFCTEWIAHWPFSMWGGEKGDLILLPSCKMSSSLLKFSNN